MTSCGVVAVWGWKIVVPALNWLDVGIERDSYGTVYTILFSKGLSIFVCGI